MHTIKTFIKNNSGLSYFSLTFLISWGGVFILGARYGMPAPSEQALKVWPFVFIPYFLGPSLSALLMIGILKGGEGFRELWSRWLKWRVSFLWYAIALLTMPLITMAILLLLSLVSPVFLPAIFTTADKFALILSGMVIGLVFGGILEELGWTGFAIPNLRLRNNILNTGMIVGFLWGLWHFFPTFWASGDASGALSLSLFLPPCLFYIGVLPAYRVLMVWVYDRTRSLFVNMLMHMSVTASTLFIFSPGARGVELSIYYFVLTVVIWIIALTVIRFSAKAQASSINAAIYDD